MQYFEWNRAIGSFFFNEQNAEKEVYLFTSLQDIMEIGKKNGVEGSEQDVLKDFYNALIYNKDFNIPGGRIVSPIEMACIRYRDWENREFHDEDEEDYQRNYPYYLSYLILFILPLTVEGNPTYRASNYYDRVYDFFIENRILPSNSSRRIIKSYFYKIDQLWHDLEEWSIDYKATEWGYFELHPFSNQAWVHVGYPMSQCIFPSYAHSHLPELYKVAGLVPGEKIGLKKFRNLLGQLGKTELRLNNTAVSAIEDEANELGQSILKIVLNHYNSWNGETNVFHRHSHAVQKGITISPLRLCLEIDRVNETAQQYFRLHSTEDYPSDLKFDDLYECIHQTQGFSKRINLPFEEGSYIEDKDNKWRATIPTKDVRILIDGENYHIDDWVEVPHMVFSSPMLLVTHERFYESILTWCAMMEESNYEDLKLVGLPENYHVIKLQNPTISHPDIAQLSIQSTIKIFLRGGVSVGFRKYLPAYLPEVFLENGHGNERVYLIDEVNGDEIELIRKSTDLPIWNIPGTVQKNTKYIIIVEHVTLRMNIGITIVNYNYNEIKLGGIILPKRNAFGEISYDEESGESYCSGSQIIFSDPQDKKAYIKRQEIYGYFFQTSEISKIEDDTALSNYDSTNDILLHYFASKLVASRKNYGDVFESIYYNNFDDSQSDYSISLSQLKRFSLNLLDSMGFIDYDYQTERIIALPPRLVPVPARAGRRALLIGVRTPQLIQRMKQLVEKVGLEFNAATQDELDNRFMLPSTITIRGYSNTCALDIENRFREVAGGCGIPYDSDEYPQVALAGYSGDIDQYRGLLRADDNFNDQDWSLKIFNSQLLKFVRPTFESIDKSFALIEYKLNEYTYHHRLWINNIAHEVDKNWGRYLILKQYNQHVIKYIKTAHFRITVLIPAGIPLPRLIAKAIILLSGRAPSTKSLTIGGRINMYNIYKNVPLPLAKNYFKKIGQLIEEVPSDVNV
ncbi:MAG: hypothetical protein K9N35_11690 [Candidatus Marinimicrobia bacterium]|nr:hypothetical protein [Candidatus Neomarinimicrobiota bacterium]